MSADHSENGTDSMLVEEQRYGRLSGRPLERRVVGRHLLEDFRPDNPPQSDA